MSIVIDGKPYDFRMGEAAIFIAARTAQRIKIIRFKKKDRIRCYQESGEINIFYPEVHYTDLHPEIVKMIDSKDPEFPRGN